MAARFEAIGREMTGATTTVLRQGPVDDYLVGVAAIAADGDESLDTFAGREPPR